MALWIEYLRGIDEIFIAKESKFRVLQVGYQV